MYPIPGSGSGSFGQADEKVPDEQGGPAGALAVAVVRGVDFDQIKAGHLGDASSNSRASDYFPPCQPARVRGTDSWDVGGLDHVRVNTDIDLTVCRGQSVVGRGGRLKPGKPPGRA